MRRCTLADIILQRIGGFKDELPEGANLEPVEWIAIPVDPEPDPVWILQSKRWRESFKAAQVQELRRAFKGVPMSLTNWRPRVGLSDLAKSGGHLLVFHFGGRQYFLLAPFIQPDSSEKEAE